VNLFSDAFAADPAEAPKPQPTAPSTAEPQASAKQAPKKDEEAVKAPAAANADKGSSPQRFVPSEQVRADFDVSFPIDI
jgi:hypothetical protein